MPDQVIPVTGLDTVGLIEDMPAVSLPPNAFSDCRNVRFRNGAVSKMKGDINVFPNVQYQADTDVLKYIIWWPNPNLSVFNRGYYILIVEQAEGEHVYVLQVGELGTEEEPILLSPTNTTNCKTRDNAFQRDGNWQHTFFQGGFALVINNGLEAPRYVLDTEDNVTTSAVDQLADLPGWASYAADPVYLALLGESSINGLEVTAGVIRTYGDFLIAGNLVERDSTGTILRALPGIVRTSDIAAPGSIPQNWNPFAEAVNTADEFVITADGVVQDFAELQGNMYIYSNSSISVVTRTGNPSVPFSVRPVTPSYGAVSVDTVLEFDGRHFVIGAQDLYLFSGHPGSIQSVAEGKVRDYFYRNLNNNYTDNVFIMRYQPQDELWICYPTLASTSGQADEALIWNYRNNTWSKRDINNAFAGVTGPIPGGGVPMAGFELGGNGNDNEIIVGETHQVTFSELTHTYDTTTDGNVHIEDILFDIPGTATVTAEPLFSNTPSYLVILREDFFTGTGTGDRPPVRFTAEMQDGTGTELAAVSIELPFNLGQNAAYGSADYRTFVLEPIIEVIEDALESHGRISLRRIDTGEYANTAFVIEFNFEANVDADGIAILGTHIVGRVQLFAPSEIRSIRDVDASDRPISDDGFITDEYDVVGEVLPLDTGPDSWTGGGTLPTTVFSFDLSHITDDIHELRDNPLDDFVFFIRGLPTGFDHPAYVDLTAPVHRGSSFVDRGDEPDRDGGMHGQMDGDDIDDEANGGRLTNYIFDRTNTEFEVDLARPLFGDDIRALALEDDTTEFALLIEANNEQQMTLVAYRARQGSDGVADYDRDSPCLAFTEEGCAPFLHINIHESVYDKDLLAYRPGTALQPIAVSLTTASTVTSTQEEDFIRAILFASTELEFVSFNRLSSANTVTFTSVENQTYQFSLSIDSRSTDLLPLFSTETAQLGQVQIGGVDGLRYIAPCVRVRHVDPNGVTYFDFTSDLIELSGDPADVQNEIANSIRAVAPQWSYNSDTRVFESAAITYNEAAGDEGVPYPDEDGTYKFTANREHAEFAVDFYAGNIIANGTERPTFTLTREGIWDGFDGEGWGSYLAINMSNRTTFVFYLGDTTRAAVDQLRDEIATRIPGIELITVGDRASIIPTVIGESTITVSEMYLNVPESIEDFRRLVSSVYPQDINNPTLPRSLPEAILTQQVEIDFPVTQGNEPYLDGLNIETDFDFDRAWSAETVNFAMEYPIFASSRVFPNLKATNAVLAGEVGFSFPTFTMTGIEERGYESFVRRDQMALSPEFTTEALYSVALWADGSTQVSLSGDVLYNALQMDLSPTDNPGQRTDLNNAQHTNTFYISEDYKMDIRLTGRFLNWKLSDELDSELESPGGKTFSQQSDWRLSGLQWSVRAAGRR